MKTLGTRFGVLTCASATVIVLLINSIGYACTVFYGSIRLRQTFQGPEVMMGPRLITGICEVADGLTSGVQSSGNLCPVGSSSKLVDGRFEINLIRTSTFSVGRFSHECMLTARHRHLGTTILSSGAVTTPLPPIPNGSSTGGSLRPGDDFTVCVVQAPDSEAELDPRGMVGNAARVIII